MTFILTLLTVVLSAVLSDAIYKTTITFYITCFLLVIGVVAVFSHIWFSASDSDRNKDDYPWMPDEDAKDS